MLRDIHCVQLNVVNLAGGRLSRRIQSHQWISLNVQHGVLCDSSQTCITLHLTEDNTTWRSSLRLGMWQSINHLNSSQCWGQCGVNVHHITTPEITANETTTAAATTWVWALQVISVYGFECFVVVEVVVFGLVVLYKQQQWWWSCWCSVGSQSGSNSPTVAIAIVCGRSSSSFSS